MQFANLNICLYENAIPVNGTIIWPSYCPHFLWQALDVCVLVA